MMRFAMLAALLCTLILMACGGSESSTTRYEVTVNFNTSVTQEDIEETKDVLQSYDEDLEFIIMESFPPIGRALLTTDAPDFCSMIETDLEAKTYVRDVLCEEWEEADPSLNPEEPVEHSN